MKKLSFFLPFFLLLILVVLQIHNFILFPVSRGFDALNHLDYVGYLRTNHSIPMAHEGWELYQPPLYYLLLFPITNPLFIRFLNGFVFVGLLIAVFLFFKKITKNTFLGIISTVIIASLPVVIYSLPAISNELFSGMIISFTIMYYVTFAKRFALFNQIIFGCLLGLSLLSKATSFVLLFCIIVDQIIQHKNNFVKLTKHLLVILGFVLIISGWFYIRNLLIYQNPFTTSVDFPKFHIVQGPRYRDIKFLTDISGFLSLDLFKAHHYSLWSGTYFSWFYDGHNVIVPVQAFSKAGALLVISSVPLFLMFIFGLIKELSKKDKSYLMILYPIVLFLSYIAYTIKLPFYSSVKGVFLISSIISFTYFVIRFLAPLKKYYVVFLMYMLFFVFIVVKNFWILKDWYN